MPTAPPMLARRLLRFALPDGPRGETILGDLDEEFQIRARETSPSRAAAWYWRAALSVSVGVGYDERRRRRRPIAASTQTRTSLMDTLLQDLRPTLRLLAKQRAFATAAILTLALGIGANLAVFTVAWHLLLKPLPYPHGDRLVDVWETWMPQGFHNSVMPANYRAWAGDMHAFDAIAAYTYFTSSVDLTRSGEPEQLKVRYVTGDYFKVFEMAPLLGRGLDDRDTTPDATTIVLSEGLWRRKFGGDRSVIGRDVRVGGASHLVVGVMPDAFGVSAGRMDAWAGYPLPPEGGPRLAAHYLGVVARLKPSVSIAHAVTEITQIAARDEARFPETNKNLSATVTSMADARGGTARAGVGLLAGASGLLLLIACANLASLQLARGLARAREFGLRAALGASRRRLLGQQTIEGFVIAIAGTAVGLTGCILLLRVLAGVAPQEIATAAANGLDVTVAGFAVLLTLIVTGLSATAPAWRASSRATSWARPRIDTGDRSTARLRTILVSGQIALAVMLLIAATLLVSSLSNVLAVRPGFDPAGVIAFDVSLPDSRYDSFAARAQLFDRISEELRGLPGVTATCAINQAPFDSFSTMTYVPEGQVKPVSALPRNVTAGCFDVLRMPILRGRAFTNHEAARVGIVTDRFARTAWPDADPIGKRVHLGVADGALIDVVGVVADSRQISLEAGGFSQFYEAATEDAAFPASKMLVRTDARPNTLLPAVRAAVRRVDPDQPVARLRTLEDVVSASLSERRFNLILILSFVTIAVLLAAVGIYGLLNQLVAQRRAEIGIRMALGASTGSVSRLILRHAALTIGVGLPLGLVGAWWASRLVTSLLYRVSPTEPWVYAAAAATLAGVALVSGWLPARRAARIDPLAVLRQ